MSNIVEQINKDLIAAMKAKDEVGLRALRSIKSAFLLAATEVGNKEVNDEVAMKAMMKMAKQRKDSIEIFEKENRMDLAIKEKEELSVIEKYLPQQMSSEEITEILKNIVNEVGATGLKDIGKIMPLAMKKLAGKADGKAINEALKNIFQ
ncbi:MAG: GatB/YqeY domain-containing protein [Bacteroidota bacterium]|nr:GatB/YqeY domain-containing protein [Bacteroidota bacterium]